MNNLIETIIQAIVYKYPDDGTRPGLTISYLRNKNYYCSIIRYNLDGKAKTILHKAQNKILELALKDVSAQLLNSHVAINPMDKLAEVIKNDKATSEAYNEMYDPAFREAEFDKIKKKEIARDCSHHHDNKHSLYERKK